MKSPRSKRSKKRKKSKKKKGVKGSKDKSPKNKPKSLKKIEGRIEVEASVPLGFCVALGTVRRPKFMKSVCLVVQTKGGATLFTTRPCRVLCDKQVASGPRKKSLVRATPGPGAPAGHLVMHALLPAPNPGSMTVTEAPKLQSVHALVERLNQVASVPLHTIVRLVRQAVAASLPLETVESQGNRGAVAVVAFRVLPRPCARAWPPAEDGARSGSEAHRVPATDARVPCLAGADPAANHDCLPTSVPGRFASLERMQCGCVAAQRLPFIHSRRGHVPPTRGHQQHDPRGFRRR